jgi:ClpP class serine protease
MDCQANANKEITGIVMVYDTPGGTVDGTETLANTIASSKKPIVAFIDGLCGKCRLLGSIAIANKL